MSDKYSKLFAEYSAGLQYEDVPAESAHEAKRRILDSIGVSMAAFSEDAPKAARMFAYDFEQPNGATVWGAPSRVTPEAATFANGLMTRYLDFNDTYLSLEPLHPSDMIPGFMALCEWAGKPPRDILTAIAAGYEVSVNLCDAASVRAYQWDHVVYTGIGAACGAGSIMEQSADTIEHTIFYRKCAARVNAADTRWRTFHVEGRGSGELGAKCGVREPRSTARTNRTISAVRRRDGFSSRNYWAASPSTMPR